MTPEQLHNNLFLFASTGGALLVDTAGWRIAPRLTRWLAFVPLLSRRLPIGPTTRAALSTAETEGSYRAAPQGRVDWSRLPGPRSFTAAGVRFDLDPPRARLLARLPFVPHWFSFGGVAVLRLRVEGDAVVVGCRAVPWLSLTSAAFFGALLALAVAGGAWSIGVLLVALLGLFNVVAAVRTRQVFTPIVRHGIDLLAERMAR